MGKKATGSRDVTGLTGDAWKEFEGDSFRASFFGFALAGDHNRLGWWMIMWICFSFILDS